MLVVAHLVRPSRSLASRTPLIFEEALLRATRHPIVEDDLKRIVSSPLPWSRLFGKTVLITGANGFVPAYMLETLMYLNETARADIHLVALVRNKEKALRRLGHLAGRCA
jgi:hypothetical protein